MRWVFVLVFLAQTLLYATYLTDDSYIYAQFARNLAHGQLAFNSGEPVHAATSPLWAGFGALAERVGVPAFWALKLLAICFGIAALLCFSAALRAVCRQRRTWILGSLAFAVQPWFVRWSSSGMETAMGAFCVCYLLWALYGASRERSAPWLGLVLGLGPLVRPELLLLLGLVALSALRDARMRRQPLFFALLALPSLLWIALAKSTGLSVLPTTMFAKSTGAGLSLDRLALNLRVLVQIVGTAAALPILWWLYAGARRQLGLRGWAAPALLGWVFLLPAIYLWRDVQVVSRYLEIWMPVPLFAAFVVADSLPRWTPRLAALHIGLSLALSIAWISPSTRAFSGSMDRAMGDFASWLRANTAPTSVVAAYDIGLLAYRSQRRIFDLGGLIDPRIAELRRRMDDEEIVRSGRFLQLEQPELLLHRAAHANELAPCRWGNWRARPLFSRRVANLGLSRSAPVIYTLYRLEQAGG